MVYIIGCLSGFLVPQIRAGGRHQRAVIVPLMSSGQSSMTAYVDTKSIGTRMRAKDITPKSTKKHCNFMSVRWLRRLPLPS